MNFSILGSSIDNQYLFYQQNFRFQHRFCELKFKFEHLIIPKNFKLMHLKMFLFYLKLKSIYLLI